VKFATSIVDFIFRALGVEYLHRYDLAHIKPEVEGPLLDAARTPPEPPSMRQLSEPVIQEKARPRDNTLPPVAATIPAAAPATVPPEAAPKWSLSETLGDGTGSPLDAQLDKMMGDAPVCDVCGHITVRNGACYKCLNCGNSMGCS